MRTTADATVAPEEAMKLLREGNDRFVKGAPQATRTNEAMRKARVGGRCCEVGWAEVG